MWMIIFLAAMFLMLMGMAAYGEWNNRQARKYKEWVKEHGNEQEAATQA